MNLKFYESDVLEKELEGLPPLHRIAFAAACCERLLPNYNAFSRIEDWGDTSVLRAALDEVWQILQAKPVEAAKIHQLVEDCKVAIPDSDDFGGLYDWEAQDAAIAICVTLEACLDPRPQQVIRVANCVAESIDAFVQSEDKSFNDMSIEKQQEAVANHPFAIREMAKQCEDLKRLKETTSLDSNFLLWLRTSFNNDGKSLIDLA